MRSGSLRNKIIFQLQTDTQDDFGQPIQSWNDILTTWASINPISGKESFLANQKYSTVSHKLKVRYSTLMSVKQRIKYGTRYFNIINILDFEERKKEVLILAEEVAQ